MLARFLRALLLDSGVLGSNVDQEVQSFFKAIEKEGLQGGKGGKNEVGEPQHIHAPGIQQEPDRKFGIAPDHTANGLQCKFATKRVHDHLSQGLTQSTRDARQTYRAPALETAIPLHPHRPLELFATLPPHWRPHE